MKLNELKSLLRAHPSAQPSFALPDGDMIPAHFHITEVGHVAKRFIDCGGKLHDITETCLLQTHVADDVDHRLDAGTFAKILDLGRQVLPHENFEVEIEYDDGVVSQYPIAGAQVEGETILLKLSSKHTNCLAKQKCGTDGEGCGCAPAESATPATACC